MHSVIDFLAERKRVVTTEREKERAKSACEYWLQPQSRAWNRDTVQDQDHVGLLGIGHGCLPNLAKAASPHCPRRRRRRRDLSRAWVCSNFQLWETFLNLATSSKSTAFLATVLPFSTTTSWEDRIYFFGRGKGKLWRRRKGEKKL